jgi:hypothetical protein
MEKEYNFRLLSGFVREARTLNNMSQRSIAMFLHLKGLSTKDVQTELVQVLWFDDDALAYSIVTQYLRNDVILQMSLQPGIERKIKVFRLQTIQFWRHLK